MSTLYVILLAMVAVAILTGLVSAVRSVSKRPFWETRTKVPVTKGAALAAPVKSRSRAVAPSARAEATLAA